MLDINGLSVRIGDRCVLNGLSCRVCEGEVCALMGVNGAGKSTLVRSIMGDPKCEVVSGSGRLFGKEFLGDSIEQRAQSGLFVGFQDPVVLPGIKNRDFLFRLLGGDGVVFEEKLCELAGELGLGMELMERGVNEGFSGGEKKKNELLQMQMMGSRLAVLDEPDSGLDVWSMRAVSVVINRCRARMGFLLVTHSHSFLEMVGVDRIYFMLDGKIIREGPLEMALSVAKDGYGVLG